MQEVNLVKTTLERYKASTPTNNNIYFTTDTREIFVGNTKYGSAFVNIDEANPLPKVGSVGYFYIDRTNSTFAIKVWDNVNSCYQTLPFADTSYIKELSRDEDSIIGTRGNTETTNVSLDRPLMKSEIDTLFEN